MNWKRIPWSLWAYAALAAVSIAVIEVQSAGPLLAKILLAGFMFGWLYVLVRGVRWVWIATVVIYGLGLVVEGVSGSLNWQGAAMSIIGLVLLILPTSRDYYSPGEAS